MVSVDIHFLKGAGFWNPHPSTRDYMFVYIAVLIYVLLALPHSLHCWLFERTFTSSNQVPFKHCQEHGSCPQANGSMTRQKIKEFKPPRTRDFLASPLASSPLAMQVRHPWLLGYMDMGRPAKNAAVNEKAHSRVFDYLRLTSLSQWDSHGKMV